MRLCQMHFVTWEHIGGPLKQSDVLFVHRLMKRETRNWDVDGGKISQSCKSSWTKTTEGCLLAGSGLQIYNISLKASGSCYKGIQRGIH